ncbi:IS110 family transposase [Mucilaginibacter defluvii]
MMEPHFLGLGSSIMNTSGRSWPRAQTVYFINLRLTRSLLDSITGIASKSAQIILSEAGSDMSRFNTADHLTAWCGLAPGNHESAGKIGYKYKSVSKVY